VTNPAPYAPYAAYTTLYIDQIKFIFLLYIPLNGCKKRKERKERKDQSVESNQSEQIMEITEVVAANPDLSANGWLCPEHEAGFEESRKFCNKPAFAEEVARALLWLSRHGIPQGKHAPGSYGLKHTAEYWVRDECGLDHAYISNGAFIVAAIIAGYSVRRFGADNPNCALIR